MKMTHQDRAEMVVKNWLRRCQGLDLAAIDTQDLMEEISDAFHDVAHDAREDVRDAIAEEMVNAAENVRCGYSADGRRRIA